MDYRISVEELASEFEAMEMARNLVREAMKQIEEFENPNPLIINEKIELTF